MIAQNTPAARRARRTTMSGQAIYWLLIGALKAGTLLLLLTTWSTLTLWHAAVMGASAGVLLQDLKGPHRLALWGNLGVLLAAGLVGTGLWLPLWTLGSALVLIPLLYLTLCDPRVRRYVDRTSSTGCPVDGCTAPAAAICRDCGGQPCDAHFVSGPTCVVCAAGKGGTACLSA